MLYPQGFPKDTKMPPNDNPNEDSDPQEAPMGESTEVPPWVVPLKLPRTLDAPTKGKVKGKVKGKMHLEQVMEWVASSKALLLGHYGVTDCRVEGCCNPGHAWSKGKDWMEYYCDNHRQLIKKKHREQSARHRAKQWREVQGTRGGV